MVSIYVVVWRYLVLVDVDVDVQGTCFVRVSGIVVVLVQRG